jgi:hypothetical protein
VTYELLAWAIFVNIEDEFKKEKLMKKKKT